MICYAFSLCICKTSHSSIIWIEMSDENMNIKWQCYVLHVELVFTNLSDWFNLKWMQDILKGSKSLFLSFWFYGLSRFLIGSTKTEDLWDPIKNLRKPMLSLRRYRKNSKHSDTRNNYCNYPKIWLIWIFHRVMRPKDADRIANSVDPDQTAPQSSLIWVYSVCPDLSENLGSLR